MRAVLGAGLVVGGLLAVWVGVGATESWLYYRAIEREPYRTSHVRIAVKDVVSRLLEPYYDHALEADAGLPEYRLELSPRRLEQWHEILRRVYARGHATAEDQVWLPAEFSHRDRQLEIDLRGRGTLFTHYKERKPSFRLKFRRDQFFRGTRYTNLIIPYDQARIVGDTTLNALARHYGLLTYPTRFVTVRLNGDLLGVYQEVEHWREELAVKQFRSEGFFMSSLGDPKGGAGDLEHAGFAEAQRAFARCVVGLADEATLGQDGVSLAVEVAAWLGEGVGSLEPCSEPEIDDLLERYVDVDAMTAYMAMTTLFGASHAWGEDNLILFYDPPRGRFEPVPWDMGTLRFPATLDDPWTQLEPVKGIGRAFLRRPAVRLERNRLLWDMLERKQEWARREALRLYADIRPALDHDIEHSRRYTQRFVDYFLGAAKHNSALWREHLARQELTVELAPDGLRLVNGGSTTLRLDALRLLTASGDEVSVWPEPESGDALDAAVTVPGRFLETPGTLRVAWPTRGDAPSEGAALGVEGAVTAVHVEGRSLVTGASISADAVRWLVVDSLGSASAATDGAGSPAATGDPDEALRLPMDAPPSWARVERDRELTTWSVDGTVRLERDLVLPLGVRLRLEPGSRLLLGAGVDLFVRGDLLAEGTAERPIEIAPLDDDPAAAFGTFAVVGRTRHPVTAVLAHVTIRGGSEGGLDAAHYSGMFSVYDGSLWMRASRILDVRGEDGLNVKFGFADIRDSLFESAASDAVDLDFCHGVLLGNTIRDSHGDGLDFSGSLVLARDNRFEGVLDKGLSVGERTTILLDDNEIIAGRAGLAVKDRSLAELRPGPMRDLEIGLAVYQKKQVFGSGVVGVTDLEALEGAAAPLLTDPGAVVEPID